MTDRNKVIDELKELSGFLFKEYGKVQVEEANLYYDRFFAVNKAIDLLKEQEPKQVIGIADSIEGMEVGYCPSCNRGIANKKIDETKFCKFCGQAVKWND